MSPALRHALAWLPRAISAGAPAVAIFGPLANLALWAFAEKWYFPHKLPNEFGLSFWGRVFAPRSAMASLSTSVLIATLTVAVCTLIALPAGYALARLRLPFRSLILLAFLLPQAFPNLPVYINVARIFYGFGLNGTVLGVVLVHTVHGLVFPSDHDGRLRRGRPRARGGGAQHRRRAPAHVFLTVSPPLAAPGIMASAIFVFLESPTSSPAPTSWACQTSRPCRSSCSTRPWAATTRSRRSRR